MLTCPFDIGTGDMLVFSWTEGEIYGQEKVHSLKEGSRLWVRFSYFFMIKERGYRNDDSR